MSYSKRKPFLKWADRQESKMARLPRGFPRRIVLITGWATVFHVPRYISRVDVDEIGRYGTHGWQVRYEGVCRLFGDAKGRQRGSPISSLKEATEYLASTYKGPKVRVLSKPTTRREEGPVMEAGLRLVRRSLHGKSSSCLEVYVEAMSPSNDLASRRVYVGTERIDGRGGTVTPERLEAAVCRARDLRKNLVDTYRQMKPLWKR